MNHLMIKLCLPVSVIVFSTYCNWLDDLNKASSTLDWREVFAWYTHPLITALFSNSPDIRLHLGTKVKNSTRDVQLYMHLTVEGLKTETGNNDFSESPSLTNNSSVSTRQTGREEGWLATRINQPLGAYTLFPLYRLTLGRRLCRMHCQPTN